MSKKKNKNTKSKSTKVILGSPMKEAKFREINQTEKQASPLEEQMFKLKYKMNKIEFYQLIFNKINEEMECSEKYHLDTIAELDTFISNKIEMIENDVEETQATSVFTTDEVDILKEMANRIKLKNAVSKPNTTIPIMGESDVTKLAKNPKPKLPITRANSSDKIRFALNNRHLDHKNVKVNLNGESVSGVVVGLDAPNVVVQLQTGKSIEVLLEDIIA